MKYSIPRGYNGGVFLLTHFQQLNVILNGVINMGYKLVYVYSNSTYNVDKMTYYFAKPWISTSSELDEADASQLTITGYPNPTNGIINLEILYKNGNEPNENVVINEGGFIIYTKQFEHIESGEIVTIDLSAQKTGIFFITAKNLVYYSSLIKVIRY